jgi:hypothetical protein
VAWKTKLPKPEWLFKQSSYGGIEHFLINVGEWTDYINAGDWSTPFYVDTLCQKRYKYNVTYSVVRCKDGLIRNICSDCISQYEPYEQETEEAKQERKQKRADDKALPF